MGAGLIVDLVIKGGDVLDRASRGAASAHRGIRSGLVEAVEETIPAARALKTTMSLRQDW